VIVGVVVFILLIIGAAYLIQNNSNKTTQTYPQEAERGGPKTVVITNTGKLATILLAEQFSATKNQLISYIQTQISPNITSAQVVGDPTIEGDGSIDITVSTNSPAKQFVLHIDRSQVDTLTFTVVGTAYQQVVQVYGSSGSNE